MNILLLTVPSDNRQETERFIKQKRIRILKFISPEKIYENLPSFSLLYLAPLLKQKGHKVFYFEGHYFKTLQELVLIIQKKSIHIVGITSLICNWQNVKTTAKILKQLFPDIKIFAGGRFPSYAKEEGLKEASELDGIIYGEGECTFLEIVSKIERKEQLTGIKGSIVRENGRIVSNPPRPLIANLDGIPFPDRDLVCGKDYIPPSATYKKLPHTYIYCSRGCSYTCIYCDTEKLLRVRSPSNIVDEIEYCANKYSIKDFTLLDNAISVYRERINGICEEILRRKLNIVWSTELRVDAVSLDKLRLMKKAGCWKILYGIESGVQKNLDFLNKKISIDEIIRAVNLTKQAEIETLGSFIFGIPGETYEEGLKTIKFACELDLDYASFSNLTPFPNTMLAKRVSDWGNTVVEAPFDLSGITFVPYSMKYKQLKNLIKISTISFYFRYKYILKKVKKINTIHELLRLFRGLLRVAIRVFSSLN